MSSTNLKGPLVTLAVIAGLLAVAGPASADARLNSTGNGLAPVDFSAVPEMDASANAFFRPEVNDEVLAYVNYEPDVYS